MSHWVHRGFYALAEYLGHDRSMALVERLNRYTARIERFNEVLFRIAIVMGLFTVMYVTMMLFLP